MPGLAGIGTHLVLPGSSGMLWLGRYSGIRLAECGLPEAHRTLAPGPCVLPPGEILPELVSSGIQPLAQEIKGRFTSSLVRTHRASTDKASHPL